MKCINSKAKTRKGNPVKGHGTLSQFRKRILAGAGCFGGMINEFFAIFFHGEYRFCHISLCVLLVVFFFLGIEGEPGGFYLWRCVTTFLVLLVFLVLMNSLWWILIGCCEVFLCTIAICFADKLR